MKPGPLRTALRAAHRWVSLVLGLPIALVAASGAAADYWFEIDALADPAFYAGAASGPPLPLERLVAAAHPAEPGARIANLFLNHDGRVAIASLTGPWGERLRDLAIDRASGAVLAKRWQDAALINRLYAFHTRLLLGDGARGLMLALTAVFLGLLFSGLWLWWPDRSGWRRALAWRLQRRQRLLDLHAKAGVYALALTALAGGTALLLLWPGPAPYAAAAPAITAAGPLQRLVDRAELSAPGMQAVNVLDPEAAGAPLRVILWRPAGLLRREAIRMVAMDRATGMAAPVALADAHEIARALHNGRIGGELGRAAMALGALVPLLLYITGLVHWARRSLR